MNLRNLKIDLSGIRSWRPKEAHTLAEKAHNDWRSGFLLFVIVLFIAIGFESYLFYKISRSDVAFTTLTDKSNAEIDERLLQAVLTHYEEKEKRFVEFQQSTSTPKDPYL